MGTIALDAGGDLSGAVTTSGMAFKMHGRVGDSPIIGAGLFVDNEVGAAVSSGVGEEVIRICGTHLVIELMRLGRKPEQACREAVMRIVNRDPAKAKEMQVGFVAISNKGEVGAFSVLSGFTYSVTNSRYPNGKVFDCKIRLQSTRSGSALKFIISFLCPNRRENAGVSSPDILRDLSELGQHLSSLHDVCRDTADNLE